MGHSRLPRTTAYHPVYQPLTTSRAAEGAGPEGCRAVGAARSLGSGGVKLADQERNGPGREEAGQAGACMSQRRARLGGASGEVVRGRGWVRPSVLHAAGFQGRLCMPCCRACLAYFQQDMMPSHFGQARPGLARGVGLAFGWVRRGAEGPFHGECTVWQGQRLLVLLARGAAASVQQQASEREQAFTRWQQGGCTLSLRMRYVGLDRNTIAARTELLKQYMKACRGWRSDCGTKTDSNTHKDRGEGGGSSSWWARAAGGSKAAGDG